MVRVLAKAATGIVTGVLLAILGAPFMTAEAMTMAGAPTERNFVSEITSPAGRSKGSDSSSSSPLRPKIRKIEQDLRVGKRVGSLEVEKLGLKTPYVQGADLSSLERAPGHYVDTDLPGEGRTVGIAGHRTTFGAPFRRIHRLGAGDEIRIDMPYGDFTYAVKRTEIVKPEAVKVLRARGQEQIVLTACHPPGSAALRIVAFAELVAGPTIEEIAVSFGAHPSAPGAPPESQS
jgi:LPXTG-site transpeptidase (sortase) family protein